jgi:hypothetical protein
MTEQQTVIVLPTFNDSRNTTDKQVSVNIILSTYRPIGMKQLYDNVAKSVVQEHVEKKIRAKKDKMSTLSCKKKKRYAKYKTKIEVLNRKKSVGTVEYNRTLTRLSKRIYILCPVYFKGNNICDTQMSITGCIKVNESPEDAVSRELSEEIGAIVKQSSVHLNVTTFKNKTFYNTFVHVKSLSLVQNDGTNNTEDTRNDDNSRKIQCVIYGTKKELESFANSIVARVKATDNVYNQHAFIGGVSVLPFRRLMPVLQHTP